MMLGASVASVTRNSSGVTPTLVRNLEANFYKYQRHNVPFTVTNMTTGVGTFNWKILNLATPGITATSSATNPEFTLPKGYYLLFGEVQGLNPNPVQRVFFEKRITVLGTNDTWDFELDLDDGNNIIDCSGWGDDIKVRANKLDATVGRIRFNNYTGTGVQFIVDEPMTINSFVGSHGLYFVNCNDSFVVDAVGDTDQFYITLDGIGQSTSHGINLNLISDIRCRGVEVYGVDIQVDEVGASGIRELGDASASYNRAITTPLEGMKFAHIKGRSGAEFMYFGFTNDTTSGGFAPPQFTGLDVWDIEVETCVRNPIQLCNQINARVHNIIVHEACTGLEPSHDNYISSNSGNQSCKMFNLFLYGGVRGIFHEFGETGQTPYFWNIVQEVTGTGGASAYNFLKVGDAANCPIYMWNITTYGVTDETYVNRFDASTGTQDVNKFILVNQVYKMGNAGVFWQKDGTNPETGWDRTSGNLGYTTATEATAKLGADYLPDDATSPAINGGADILSVSDLTYSDFFGEYDDLTFVFDIDGYINTDGNLFSGAGAGIPLKLAEL